MKVNEKVTLGSWDGITTGSGKGYMNTTQEIPNSAAIPRLDGIVCRQITYGLVVVCEKDGWMQPNGR
jgi:hypothetical protein